MGQLTQNFVDLAMATCKEGRHPSLTVWEAQQLLHAWNDREALRARVAELAQLLDEGSAYVHSFAMLSKHPTAPAYAMDLAQRMRSAAGLSGNKTAASNEGPR